MNRLAILIPTIEGREWYLERLMNILQPQIDKHKYNAEVIILKDNKEMTIGAKRNMLMRIAIDNGFTYRAFCDDDDTLSENYLSLNLPGMEGGYDCNSLVGVYSVNGYVDPAKNLFYHSIDYNEKSLSTGVWDDANGFYRPPNHLNTTKIDLIKDIQYEDKNFGEDMCHAMEVAKLGVLKNEYKITEPFYNYLFRTKS